MTASNQAMQLTASKPDVHVHPRELNLRAARPCRTASLGSIDSLLCSSPFGLRLCHGFAVRSILVAR